MIQVGKRCSHDAFGNVLLDTNPGFQPFGFQSGHYDPDTSLIQFGARWYDPSTGRWLSKDPILLEGGFNLYAFCGNDPVNFADPWGCSTIRIITADGATTLVDPSMAAFRSAVEAQSPGSVTRLEILGHGSRNQLYVEPGVSGEGLVWVQGITDKVLMTDNCESFADLIRGKLSVGATIDLNGCNTGREYPFCSNNNIAQQLSSEVPGVVVIGNRGFGLVNELSNPFNRDQSIRFGKENHVLRIKRRYLNGGQK